MLKEDGWIKYCTWEHSQRLRELYTERCLLKAEEMTCHAQAVELIWKYVSPGDTLLDVGCGSGYFYHALRKRKCPVEYYGIDAAPTLIEIGKKHMPKFGLSAERLKVMRMEDMDGSVDHVVCINVLSNVDNYHRSLERMLRMTRKTIILRESCHDNIEYLYVLDKYLDDNVELKVHVNTYNTMEFMDFIRSYGFDVRYEEDRYTGGKPQMVIDYPQYWKFFVAKRMR